MTTMLCVLICMTLYDDCVAPAHRELSYLNFIFILCLFIMSLYTSHYHPCFVLFNNFFSCANPEFNFCLTKEKDKWYLLIYETV